MFKGGSITGFLCMLLPALLALMSLQGCRRSDGGARLPEPEARTDRSADLNDSMAAGEGRDPVVEPPRSDGAGVAIRLKRNVGKVRIYEGSFDRRQVGKNSFVETGKFYLTFFTNDHTKGYDRISIRRTFLDRTRTYLAPYAVAPAPVAQGA